MPEGDTIYRTAANLRRALEGAVVTGGRPARLRDQTVAAVEARGKHLLVWFAPSGLALHTHMMMSGSWHLYRPGSRWRRSPGAAKVVLETSDWVAVCFAAPVVELLTESEVAAHPWLARLGPDALADDTDVAGAARRLSSLADTEIGVALLDQRVLAGVGNVYRCETLFVERVDPWARVGDLGEDVRERLVVAAERMLKANADRVRRTTTPMPGPRLWVYGRARQPCLRCRTAIAVDRQGPLARATFWCPVCQGPGRRR